MILIRKKELKPDGHTMIKCFVVWLVNTRDVAALDDCR